MVSSKDNNSSNNQGATVGPAAGTSTTPAPLTPEDVVRQFRAIMEQIPAPQAAPGHRPFRRRLAHVDPHFVVKTINAVGASPPAQAALGRSDEDLRRAVDVIGRWAAVIDEAAGMLRMFLAQNDVRRQIVGLAALQAYRICEQLARDGADQKLAEHVREMKRMKKFGRRRRKPEPEVIAKTP